MNIHAFSMALWAIVLLFRNICKINASFTNSCILALHLHIHVFNICNTSFHIFMVYIISCTMKWTWWWVHCLSIHVWDFYQSRHSFSWFVLQSWWSVLCHDFLQFVFLGFFFINVHLYRFMILCSEKYTIAKWFLVSSTRLPCTIG